jgi:transposase InsO family protein
VKFGFIVAEKAHYPVTVLCEVLGVSRSGFYAWRKRPPSKRAQEDSLLKCHVVAAFEASRQTYGSPRIQQELAGQGVKVGRNRVARLMREEELRAREKSRFVVTTDSNHGQSVPDNLLERDFSAKRENEKWVGDITYLPTASGFIFLAVLLDLYSRRVVGWAVSNTMGTELPLRALESALATRTLTGPLIHHTDRGIQYVSRDYVECLQQHGIQRSMSRRANCWDNAPAESFFSTLKMELPEATCGTLHPKDVRRAVLDYIAHYNLKRRHSSIGYLSPVDYESAARMVRAD